MRPQTALFATCIFAYTGWLIYTNYLRITRKFLLNEAVRLDDLTQPGSTSSEPLKDKSKFRRVNSGASLL